MKKSILIVLIATGAFILSLICARAIPVFGSLELKALDWRFSTRGSATIDDAPIVLVTIDDASFESLSERWPWPRHYYAKVIDNLTAAGATAIGIDVILDQPDLQNPGSDSTMAAAVARSGRVVLARKLESHTRAESYRFLVDPAPMLARAANEHMGLVSIEADADGIYRRYPVVQAHQDVLLNSFAMELVRIHRGFSDDLSAQLSGNSLAFGDYQIPFYDASTLLINFAGPRGTFPQYSFASVMDDAQTDLGEAYDLDYFSDVLLPEGVFRDKIVIVGSTVAELHDNFPTPFFEYTGTAAEMPGAEILANATRTILSESFYRQSPPLLLLLLTLILTAFIALICMRFPARLATLISLGMVLIYLATAFVLFIQLRLVLEIVFPTLALLLTFGGITIINYYYEQKEKRRITDAFGHYVSPKLVKQLQNNPEALQLGGEERVVSVLFSDIANFTSIAESLGHRELVRLLNDYLTEMSELILEHDGSIDKYIGDAIMAEFGVPVHYQDHALKSCLAALAMQGRLKELSREWRRSGAPSMASRIGINTGNMVVGNMGSPKKFNYTVIGDEVNLAARLESANKIFGTRIMISEFTHHFIKDTLVTRPLDRIIVKGKSKPVAVFELIAKKGEKLPDHLEAILPLYHHGVRYYEEREWSHAESAFNKCLRLMPDDGPSRLYLKRVQDFALTPPPPDWNRVYELHSK